MSLIFSLRVADTYHDASSLYKMYDRYFIVLQIKQDGDENKAEELELILGEYGQKHMSVQLSKYYLIEHGETMIENKSNYASFKMLCLLIKGLEFSKPLLYIIFIFKVIKKLFILIY